MRRKTIQLLSIGLFISLLLWGGYTLLFYLGVPVHMAVLTPVGTQESLKAICQGDILCRGFYSLFPFIENTLTRTSFLGWYAIASALLFALFLGWNYLQTVRWDFRLRLTPWKILLFFVGSMWLLFTCLSYIQSGGASIRRLVEPLPQVYVKAGPEAIEELQKNFATLKKRGCLENIGVYGNGADAYWYKTRCVQTTFLTRVMPPLIVVLIFLFELLIAGRFVLKKVLRLRPHRLLVEAIVSVGLGVCVWIALLWFAAVFKIFTFSVGWALVVLVPAVGYRHARYWIRQFLTASWEVHYSWRSPAVFLVWLLISYLALNFINVVRPFPIGWDDLGSYINRPRLLVSYGEFIFLMSSFGWEYLTALGFLLFGYGNTFGATSAMMINWTEGLLAVLAIFTFSNVFLGKGRGVLSASLYYFLPLVGHFSFADMKIDNAVFTMGALATFMLFLFLFYQDREDAPDADYSSLLWVLLAGVFAGFAFGMKVTAIMVLMALGAVLIGASLHWMAFAGSVLFASAVFANRGALDIGTIVERLNYGDAGVSQNTFTITCVVLGIFCFLIAGFLGRQRVLRTVLATLMLIAGFLIAIFPWIEHNNILNDSGLTSFSLRAPNTIAPLLDTYGTMEDKPGRTIFRLSPELIVDSTHANCKATGGVEELGRYWGSRKGWRHYLTLPFRSVNNLDSAGYYVTTMPALLLFPLLLLLPFFWMAAGRWVRWLWLGTMFLLWQWVFLANGIPWYGIGTFLGLAMCLEVLCVKAPDLPNRILAGGLVGLSVVAVLGMRMWQFEQQRNLFEYPLGKVSATALEERTIPHYNNITETLLERYERFPDRPYVYRVGTFMPYFVPKNLEIIGVSDHQLDYFNCLYQERDPKITIERMKGLGFNSIIFDTNTATIEKDPNGSLHKKVDAFAKFLNNPETGLHLVINDPGAGVVFLLIP